MYRKFGQNLEVWFLRCVSRQTDRPTVRNTLPTYWRWSNDLHPFILWREWNCFYLRPVLGSISDTCIMIRIMILKSIKYHDTFLAEYQYHWYILTVSVSKIADTWSLIHLQDFENFDKECINYLSDTETELTMLARYGPPFVQTVMLGCRGRPNFSSFSAQKLTIFYFIFRRFIFRPKNPPKNRRKRHELENE